MDSEELDPIVAFLVGFVLAGGKRADETGLFSTLTAAQMVHQPYHPFCKRGHTDNRF